MEKRPTLRGIAVESLHGAVDVSAEFGPGLNVLFGANGAGKTTLLHVITNLLEGDLDRFFALKFKKITVETHGGGRVVLSRRARSGKLFLTIDGKPFSFSSRAGAPTAAKRALRGVVGDRGVYLPAFRTVLEAIGDNVPSGGYGTPQGFNSLRDRELEVTRNGPRAASNAYKTSMCRNWFGPFVPVIRFPSLADVERELVREMRNAKLRIALIDQKSFTNVFVGCLEAMLRDNGTPEQPTPLLVDSIRRSIHEIREVDPKALQAYRKATTDINQMVHSTAEIEDVAVVSRVLAVYNDALEDRAARVERELAELDRFRESVDGFVEAGRLILNMQSEPPLVRVHRHATEVTLAQLSSGYRHVVTLLFCATHMPTFDGPVLIDEPELSLHLDWQRRILSEMWKQTGGRQLLACTHSPEVAADHSESLVEVQAGPSSSAWRDEWEFVESEPHDYLNDDIPF